ncbi:MAG: hypothetical protein V1720_00385 [bacterium]
MDMSNSVSIEDFEKSLPAGYLKTLQIIFFAIGTGIFLFFTVCVILYFINVQPETPPTEEVVSMLSFIHAIIFVALFFTSKFMYGFILSDKFNPGKNMMSFQQLGEVRGNYSNLLQKIRTAEIVRLAILEGPALFGLVIILLSVMSGVIYYNSGYWLNLLSSFALWGMIYINFPRTDKLYEVVRNHFNQ